jgi:hypothetical protein
MIAEGMETDGFDQVWLYNEAVKSDGIKGSCTTIEAALEIAKSEGWITDYQRIVDITNVKDHLDSQVVIIMSTVEVKNWEDGIILPTDDITNYRHATYLYDFAEGNYLGVNSFGEDWGINGTYTMSEEYFTPEHIKAAWIFEVRGD